MKFIALTKRNFPKGHVSVDYDHIVAIEDNRLNTNAKDFAWTDVWLTNGMKLEVLETEREILDIILREEQHNINSKTI